VPLEDELPDPPLTMMRLPPQLDDVESVWNELLPLIV